MAKPQEYLWNSHYVSVTLLRTLESMFHLIDTECLLGSYYCYPHITNEKDSGLQGLKNSWDHTVGKGKNKNVWCWALNLYTVTFLSR